MKAQIGVSAFAGDGLQTLAPAMTLTLALILGGCVAPILHPLRVKPGPYVNAGLSGSLGSGEQVNCHITCQEQRKSRPGLGVHVAAGQGAVLADRYGVLLGVSAPLAGNQGDQEPSLLDMFLLTVWGTVQWPAITLGAGADMGALGVFTKVAIHWHAFGNNPNEGPALWARMFVPYLPRAPHAANMAGPPATGGQSASTGPLIGGANDRLDLGLQFTMRSTTVSYMAMHQLDGLFGGPSFPEGAQYARWLHVVSVTQAFF